MSCSLGEARVNEVRYFDREPALKTSPRQVVVVVAPAPKRRASTNVQIQPALDRSGQLQRRARKKFHPHINAGFEAFLTPFIGKPSINEEGFLDHAYIPSFIHSKKRDYPRSVGVQFNYQNQRSVGWAKNVKGMGASYKEAIKLASPPI